MNIGIRLIIAATVILATRANLSASSGDASNPAETTLVEPVATTPADEFALAGFQHTCAEGLGPVACDQSGICGRTCVCTGDFPHSILIPGSSVSMKLGGYAKLDMIRDFDAIGNTDKFDTTTIPTDGSDHQNWRLHARQTRLNLDLRGPTSLGDARGFVEVDFFGDGNALRLRHAYAEVGPLLAGQTWTTFMDPSILPDILDYENPIGMIFDRRAMLRWTQPIHAVDGLEYSLAVEDPVPVFTSNDGVYESDLPDLVGRLRYEHNRYHLQLAGFASRANFTPNVGPTSDDNAWGISLTGTLQVFAKDKIGFQFSRGDGIEGFRGFQRYALTPAGAIEAIPSTLWMGTYQHHWNSEFRSTLVYANADLDSPSRLPTSLVETDYVSANLIWQPDDRIQMGLEYLHGVRTDFDSTSGSANRLQFAVWYFLP